MIPTRILLLGSLAVFAACTTTRPMTAKDSTTPPALQMVDEVGFAELKTGDGETHSLGFVRRGNTASGKSFVVLGGPHSIEWFGRHIEPEFEVIYFIFPATLHRLSERAAAIEAVRQSLQLEQIFIFGHSEAGAVAMEYAIAHPQTTAGIVWVNGLSDHPASIRLEYKAFAVLEDASPEERAFVRAALQKKTFGLGDVFASTLSRRTTPVCAHPLACQTAFMRAGAAVNQAGYLKKLYPEGPPETPLVEGLIRSALAPDIRGKAFAAYRTRDGASKLNDVPILMIQGARDTTVHRETTQQLKEALPHAVLKIYQDSYHLPFIDENERFVTDLLRFLQLDTSLEPVESTLAEDWDPGITDPNASEKERRQKVQEKLIARRNHNLRVMVGMICNFVESNPDSDLVAGLGFHDLPGFKKAFCI